jgi:hypothetical protein
VIFLESEGEDAIERRQRRRPLAELEKHLTIAGKRVLVIGIEGAGALEAPPGPCHIFPGEIGIGHPDVEFHGVGIELDAVLEKVERFVEATFVVQLVGVFVVVVGAEKPFRHRERPPAVSVPKVVQDMGLQQEHEIRQRGEDRRARNRELTAQNGGVYY